MFLLRTMLGFVLSVFAILPATARAETLTYYWVGALAEVSNAPAESRPLFNTGVLRIQRGALGLAGRTIRFGDSGDGITEIPEAPRLEFALGKSEVEDIGYAGRLTFDENEEIVNWGIIRECCIAFLLVGVYPDREVFDWNLDPLSVSERFLTSRGYVPGTPEYMNLERGCWAVSPGENCTDSVWTNILSTSGRGQWIKDDPLAFAALVEERTKLGLANPPRSYLDIPPAPIPLPPALAMLVTATGLMYVAARSKGPASRAA